MLLTAHSTLLAVYHAGEEWIINAYAPGSHKLKLSRRIVLWGPFDHHPHSTQQAFHIYSRMNHTARLATPIPWTHCLNPSPFLVRVALKWRLFPRLSLYRVKEVMKPCLFVYLLAIHVLKTYPTGKLEDKSAQLKGSHQNYTNLDLLFLHRPTRQCTVGLSGKDTPIVHCPMHVGIYIYPFASSSCLADSSSHLFS